ncbi:RAMP superfamily CRISPR-associated protein [Sorangium sp. So ce590]|uniref:RAMP superfamily CRISPR-associated protein n=1 Tax=Sorangium sp. So ce590 TaxID=3133317 RepID=UPI003F5DAE13
MLRKLVNHAEIEMTLRPVEPLLIASGVPNATGTDLPFVLTYRRSADAGEPYLPGSSLKGVLRSHAERISRTMAPKARVCDPHFHPKDAAKEASALRVPFCGDRLRPRKGEDGKWESHDLYRQSCPICRTFGSTVYRGRLALGDAYLKDGEVPRIERRDGVGIDRFSGGASRGVKFEMEVLTQGAFRARMRLENFEDWQLGLLALLCRDLEDEMISIGHATTRGLGRLKGLVERLDVMYIVPPTKHQLDEKRVHGVGSLLEDDERRLYGFVNDDHFSLKRAPALKPQGVRRVQSFADAEVRRTFFDDAIARWSERMDGWMKS